MSKIEIEIESERKCEKCDACGKDVLVSKPESSKDMMLAELKKLLATNGSNGAAERQAQIDKLISTLAEYGD